MFNKMHRHWNWNFLHIDRFIHPSLLINVPLFYINIKLSIWPTKDQIMHFFFIVSLYFLPLLFCYKWKILSKALCLFWQEFSTLFKHVFISPWIWISHVASCGSGSFEYGFTWKFPIKKVKFFHVEAFKDLRFMSK